MTLAEKQQIKQNAWSLPSGEVPRGEVLFTEQINGQTFWYYESDEEGKYWYESSGTRNFKDRHRERERAEKRKLRDQYLH